jgi:Stigma-specific protein, Stig1
MSNGWLRGLLAAGLVFGLLAACGDDASPSADDGTAGVTGTLPTGVACGAVFCQVGEVCMGTGATATCMAPVNMTACTDDSTCNGNKCCNGACISVTADNSNCGACGTMCTAGQSCVSGVCTGLVCTTSTTTTTSDEDGGTPAAPPKMVGANGCPENEVCTAGGSGNSCMCGTGASCDVGENCTTGGVCGCGSTGAACAIGQGCCDGACVDTQTSAANCGACGTACAAGQSCTAGVCGCAVAGQTACDGTCVNLQTDAANCGKCGTECATGATCEAGACKCPAGEIPCDGACVDASDDAHCGACDAECTGQTACDERETGSGTFECLCPNFNYLNCDGTCVDPRAEATCGGCDTSCGGDDPRVCAQTEPSSTWARACECPTEGEKYCKGVNDCVDLLSDENNCGKCGVECLVDETCDAGTCTCPNANELFCEDDAGDYACVDGTKELNCYGCGVVCNGASSCDAVAKDCVCDNANKGYCDGDGDGERECIDILADKLNCGGCGIECPAGSTCAAGECSCPMGQDWCDVGDGLECAPVTEDVDNCGSCGNECSVGQNCCSSACKTPGTADDENNCGPCGVVCKKDACGIPIIFPSDEQCVAGVCECP